MEEPTTKIPVPETATATIVAPTLATSRGVSAGGGFSLPKVLADPHEALGESGRILREQADSILAYSEDQIAEALRVLRAVAAAGWVPNRLAVGQAADRLEHELDAHVRPLRGGLK